MDRDTVHDSTLIELHFLPSVYYMTLFTHPGFTTLEQWENYNKGSFRNKCLINSNQQNQLLIIPLIKGKNRSQPYREVKISYEEDWIRPMENRLKTEYGGLPYFIYYIDDLIDIFHQRWVYIFELNERLLHYILSQTGLHYPCFSQSYISSPNPRVKDLRDQLIPRYFRKYHDMLDSMDLGYFSFVPGHSIIESLFSYGPETALLIRQYREVLNQIHQDSIIDF